MAQCWNLPQFASTAVVDLDEFEQIYGSVAVLTSDTEEIDGTVVSTSEVYALSDVSVLFPNREIPAQCKLIFLTITVPQDASPVVAVQDEETVYGTVVSTTNDKFVAQFGHVDVQITPPDEEQDSHVDVRVLNRAEPIFCTPITIEQPNYTAEALTRIAYPESPGAQIGEDGPVVRAEYVSASLAVEVQHEERTYGTVYSAIPDEALVSGKVYLVTARDEKQYADILVAITKPDLEQDANPIVATSVTPLQQGAHLDVKRLNRQYLVNAKFRIRVVNREYKADADLYVKETNTDQQVSAHVSVAVLSPDLLQGAKPVIAIYKEVYGNSNVNVAATDNELIYGHVSVATLRSQQVSAHVEVKRLDRNENATAKLVMSGNELVDADLYVKVLNTDETQDANSDVAATDETSQSAHVDVQITPVPDRIQYCHVEVQVTRSYSQLARVIVVEGNTLFIEAECDTHVRILNREYSQNGRPIVAVTRTQNQSGHVDVEVANKSAQVSAHVDVAEPDTDLLQSAHIEVEIANRSTQVDADLLVAGSYHDLTQGGHVDVELSKLQPINATVAVAITRDLSQLAHIDVQSPVVDEAQDATPIVAETDQITQGGHVDVEISDQSTQTGASLAVQIQREYGQNASVLYSDQDKDSRVNARVLILTEDRDSFANGTVRVVEEGSSEEQDATPIVAETDNQSQSADTNIAVQRTVASLADVSVRTTKHAFSQSAHVDVEVANRSSQVSGRLQVQDVGYLTQYAHIDVQTQGNDTTNQFCDLVVQVTDNESNQNSGISLVVTRRTIEVDADLVVKTNNRNKRQYCIAAIAITRDRAIGASILVSESQETYSGGPAGGTGYGEDFDR